MSALKRISPLFLLLVSFAAFAPQPRAQTPPLNPERPWVGREAEIEEYLKTAPFERVETLDLGVTHPNRGWFAPGGPVDSAAWKPIRPGLYNGYWESWQNEVAAYELDKMLQIHMVPPTVEKKFK